MIKDNLLDITQRIRAAEKKAGRPENSVRLMAVSKFHPSEAVKEAILAGQFLFGENRVQEAMEKFPPISIPISMSQQFQFAYFSLCSEFGMSTTTAINIFAKMVIRKRKIPFEIELDNEQEILRQGRKAFLALREEAQKSGMHLTLDDINNEIKLAREGK